VEIFSIVKSSITYVHILHYYYTDQMKDEIDEGGRLLKEKKFVQTFSFLNSNESPASKIQT
jgi:hypothetical protein